MDRNIRVPAGNVSERDLVRRAQQRDTEALTELYRRYAPRIYRYCLFHVVNDVVAEDITEEVFLNMVESLPRYVDRGIPFAAWLYRLARDRVADYHRREARRPTEALTDNLRDAAPPPEDQALQRAELRGLRQAMAQLSEVDQMVLTLRFVEGYDVEETARQMSKSIGAIKVQQHRALRRLARLLGK